MKIYTPPPTMAGKKIVLNEKNVPHWLPPALFPSPFFPPLSLTLLIKKATCAWSHPSHCSLDGRFIFISTGNLCAAAVLLEVQSRTNLSRFDRPARLHRGEKYSQGGHLIKANTYSQPPSSISNVAMRCIFGKIESWTWNDAKASSKGKQDFLKVILN